MLLKIKRGSPLDFIMIPEKACELLPAAGKTEICLLIRISQILNRKISSEEDIIAALSGEYSENEIKNALAFWRGAGIFEASEGAEEISEISAPAVQKAKIDAEEAPFYSAKQLADAAEQNPDFKNLVSFAEERLEKILNESELARLYSFMDYIGMPASVIMLSIEDCASRGKRSLRYISKQLNDFEENGAITYEKAEELLKLRREMQDYEHYVRKMFGIGDRKLVPKEKKAIEIWQNEWKFGREMLDIAYEKTVSAASKPSISYMDKILEKWHQNGVFAPEDIDKAGKSDADAPKSYDLADFFEAAVAKKKKH